MHVIPILLMKENGTKTMRHFKFKFCNTFHWSCEHQTCDSTPTSLLQFNRKKKKKKGGFGCERVLVSETCESFSESRPAGVLCLNTDSLWKRHQSRSTVTCLLTPAPPDGADGSALMRPPPNPHPVRDAGFELSADDLQHPWLPPRL